MTPTEERLAITIDAILGFYSTGDAGRDRQSAAVIAKALLDELDIDRNEREAYLRGWNEASKEASEEIRDIERQARWEAQDAYHQGQSDGRDW